MRLYGHCSYNMLSYGFVHKYSWCFGGLWKFLRDVRGCFALLSEHNDSSLVALGFDHLRSPLLFDCVYTHTSCTLQTRKCNNKQKPGHMKGQGLYTKRPLCFSTSSYLSNYVLLSISQQKYAVTHPKSECLTNCRLPCSFHLILDARLTNIFILRLF